MDDNVEARQRAIFEEALLLGHGDEPYRAFQQLEALLPQIEDIEVKGFMMLQQALFLARAERITEARQRVQDVVNLWERTPEHLARIAVTEAWLDEARGQGSLALKKLNEILTKYRPLWNDDELRDLYEDIQFARGRLLAGIRNARLALPVLEECLTFDRPKPDAYFYINLGICCFDAEQWEKAEDALKLALSKKLDTAWSSAGHYYLGRLYHRKGALAKAMKEFEEALSDATVAGRSPKLIYDALAKTSRALGLEKESTRYSRLAKSSRR